MAYFYLIKILGWCSATNVFVLTMSLLFINVELNITEQDPGGVNLTTEEDVANEDEDEELPDFRTLKLNTENVHLFTDPESGVTF